jgi:hypothetical protein
MDNQQTNEKTKPKGGFGKIETVTNYVGISLNLELDELKRQRDSVSADNKTDVVVVIDGTKVTMTFDEFKSRLLKVD